MMVESYVIGNGVMGCYVLGVRVFNKGCVVIYKCYINGNIRGIWVDEE